MSAEKNKAVVRRFIEEAFNERNIDITGELVASNSINHEAYKPDWQRGVNGYKRTFEWLLAAFPDFRVDIEDIVADGDKVAARVSMSGTHEGEFVGIPATSRRFSVQQIHWFRLAGGKIVERWAVRDDMGMMQQLGVGAPPGRRR
ncbi:MAG TPA: ester cyclase [Rubrobacteraceae bacterium]|nr:ester cyclase [Rubrobacteraceae bacterium]